MILDEHYNIREIETEEYNPTGLVTVNDTGKI